MVTFSCDNCNDTVKKPKANQHAQRCRGSLTCIDCSKTFWSGEWNAHNSCISEAEAYQGALYKPTKKELKRKAAELAAEQSKTAKLTPDAPVSTVVAPVSEVTPQVSLADNKSVEKNAKKQKTEAVKESGDQSNLALLQSVVSADQPISIHKALKLLKAQNKLDKDAEKALLKQVGIKKNADGSLNLCSM